MKINKLVFKIGSNTLIQSAGKFVSAGLSFVSIALLTRYLGTSGYGGFTLIFSYLAFFGLISDFGLQLVTVKELASAKKKIEGLHGTYFAIKIFLGIVSSILALFFLFFLPYSLEIKIGVSIGTVAVFISGLMGYFNSIFQSRVRLDLLTLLDLLGKFITVFFIVIFVYYNLNFYFIISTVLIGNLVSFVAAGILLRDTISKYYDHALAKKLLLLSVPVGLTSLLSTLYFKVDTIILSLYKSSSDVGIYSLSYKILENVIIFWGFYMAVTYPLLAKFRAESRKQYSNLFVASIKLALVLSLAIVVVAYFLAPLAVEIFGGFPFRQSITILRILIFSLPLIFINNLFYNYFVIEEFNRIIIIGMIISLIANIVLNVIFIPKYSFMAAAYITILSEIILTFTYVVGIKFLKNEQK